MKIVAYIVGGILAAIGFVTILLNLIFPSGKSECFVYSAKSNQSPDGKYSASVEVVECGAGMEARLNIVNRESGEIETARLPMYVGITGTPFWKDLKEVIIEYPDPINAANPPGTVAGIWVTYEMQ